MCNWQRVEIEVAPGKVINKSLGDESIQCQDSPISNEDHEFQKLKEKLRISTHKYDKDSNLTIRFPSPLQFVDSPHPCTSVAGQPSKVSKQNC